MPIEARITQTPLLALESASPEALQSRVTQSPVLVLHVFSPEMRATQVPVLALYEFSPEMLTTQTAVLALVHATPSTTQRAQCWTITRRDGRVFRYTTHDEPITLFGETYSPDESLRASASSGGLASSGVGDVTVSGLISDSAISARDLAGGLFDGATIEVWVAQWGNDEEGFIPYRMTKGVLGKVSQGELSYTAEMLTPAARLQQRPLLRVHTAACRFDLGDGRCPVNQAAFTVSGTVSAVAAAADFHRSAHRVFFDTARSEADGWFDNGDLVWITGRNAGLGSEVKTWAGKSLTLWQPMPHPIAVGDEYRITPGCNKTAADHKTKFGLPMASFGGFPDIPGNDVMVRTPNAKS